MAPKKFNYTHVFIVYFVHVYRADTTTISKKRVDGELSRNSVYVKIAFNIPTTKKHRDENVLW